MAQPIFPFQPLSGANSSTSAAITGTAANITLATVPAEGGQMRMCVDGNQRIAWCYGNVTATMNTSVRMLPNTVEVFDVAGGMTQVNVVGDAAGSNISITIGRGF